METGRRQEAEQFSTRRIVIKIGTSTIAVGQNRPDFGLMCDVARQATELLNDGVEVIIVSSGAVALGRKEGSVRHDIVDKQVDAVYGQRRLMTQWANAFEQFGIEEVGQLLYTDVDLKEKAQSVKKVLTRALERGVVIVNYNDGISDEEMREVEISADNDVLASTVANLIDADTFLILTDTDGVLDENGVTLPSVDRLEDVQDLIRKEGTGMGGPWSKWIQAKSAAREGRRSVIANGRGEDTILKVARGQNVGTSFYKGYAIY